MKIYPYHTLLFALISLLAAKTYAAEKEIDSLTLEFPQGRSAIYPHFKGNDSTLKKISEIAAELNNPDSLAKLRHVSVIGGASPEGSVEINRRLSEKRAANIFKYLSEGIALPDSITSFTFLGRDWKGLKQLVETDPDVPYRDETISLIEDIMKNHPNVAPNDNLQRLQQLRNGVPYRYMYTHLFPALRASTLLFEYYPVHSPIIPPAYNPNADIDIIALIPPVEVISDRVIKCEKCCKPFYMDIRTNLLFDALLLPNIGAEFYVGKNLSIIGNWMYGW